MTEVTIGVALSDEERSHIRRTVAAGFHAGPIALDPDKERAFAAERAAIEADFRLLDAVASGSLVPDAGVVAQLRKHAAWIGQWIANDRSDVEENDLGLDEHQLDELRERIPCDERRRDALLGVIDRLDAATAVA